MHLANFLNNVFKKDGFILTDANSKDHIIGNPKNNPLKSVRVIAGKDNSVDIGISEDVVLTLQKDQRESLRYEISSESQILAPINFMDKAGTIKVLDGDNNIIFETDLVYLESVDELGFFQRLIAIIWNWIKSLFN